MKRRFRLRKVIGIILLAIIEYLPSAALSCCYGTPDAGHLSSARHHFWQALGLLLLTKILFSGFRGGGPKQDGKKGSTNDGRT